jgi:glycosyltransferase involved in cell wall biosynthesis
VPSAAFVVPGSLYTLTGGSIYDRRMVDGLRDIGWTIDVIEAAGPAEAAAALGRIPDRTVTIVDGMLFGAIPEAAAAQAGRLRLAALVHLPLASAPGLDDAAVADRLDFERRALSAARAVIVTGHATVAMLEPYSVPADRVVVVEPGTDPAPAAIGSGGSGVRLLCVATIAAGKGHRNLIDALDGLRTRAWQLVCVGSLERYPAFADELRGLLVKTGLDNRVTLTGELAGAVLSAQYHQADLFVLATLRETFGMAVAEALARGIPVVSTNTGAIPSLVGSDAGILVPPGDTAALQRALARTIEDAALRDRLRAGACRVRRGLRDWGAAAADMARALARMS